MAFYENIKTTTFNTGADLSTKQHYFVKTDTAGEIVVCSSNGENAQGILLNKPGDDAAGTVALIEGGGKCKVVAGVAISIGDYVCTGSAGKAAVADTDTEYVLGKALTASTADGQLITILLDKLTGTQT